LLRTTALVNEAWLKLRGYDPSIWDGRREYAALAAAAMRSVLVDEARREGRNKRGSGWRRVPLGAMDEGVDDGGEWVDLLDLEVLLEGLERISTRRARVVELRFFGGLGTVEVADLLGVSERTVEEEWRLARAWLRARLDDGKRGVA
jgi:RNA polymerase sigma factor (TIGR02999 family)